MAIVGRTMLLVYMTQPAFATLASCNTVAELTSAVNDASISHIQLASGTYSVTSSMCSPRGGSALCIGRNLIIEALTPGSVILDAQGTQGAPRRAIHISSGYVDLIGLRITGGYATGQHADYGGGILVDPNSIGYSLTDTNVTLRQCEIYGNTATFLGGGLHVRKHAFRTK